MLTNTLLAILWSSVHALLHRGRLRSPIGDRNLEG